MRSACRFEQLRALVQGELSASESAEIERSLHDDPGLADVVADFRDVWLLTGVGLGHAPPSRLSLATIVARDADARRNERRRWLRRAAAVVALSAGIWTWSALVRRADPAPVRLSAIAPHASAADATADRSLSRLAQSAEAIASFHPVESGRIRWLASLNEGRAVAQATGRPMWLFGYYPTCPWCLEMRRDALSDPQVIALAEQLVPVAIDLSEVEPAEAGELLARGYPLLELDDPDGEVLHNFAGRWDREDMRAQLELGLWKARSAAEPLSWESARALASTLAKALESERTGRFGPAWEGYEQLARDGGPFEFATEGRRGCDRLSGAAFRALTAAQALSDPADARRRLASAATRFAGSPFQTDFEAVLARLSRTGVFPELSYE